MEKIKEKKWINGNIEFDIVETATKHDTTIAFGNKRLVLKGNVSIEQMKGSQRWGDQVQIVAYGKELIEEVRASGTTGYNRVEIALPKEIGEALIKAFADKHLA